MGITRKIREKFEQAKAEYEGMRLPPSRAERRAESDAYEAAENADRRNRK